MYRSICLKAFALCCTSFFISTDALARLDLNLDYQLTIEKHTEDEDRVLSDLSFSLIDAYRSERITSDIDLTSDLVYEHRNNEDNNLWSGNVSVDYHFSNSLSWIFDTELTEINLSLGDELDELNSQTFADYSTGFEYRYTRQIRGEFVSRLTTRKLDYEESDLDSTLDVFELLYIYPFTDSASLTTSLEWSEQVYDNSIQSANDTENSLIRLEYNQELARLTFNIFVEQNNIEYINRTQESKIEGYGLDLGYQINSRSSLSLTLANDVQQAFELNTNTIDPQNPLLTAGTIENEQISLQYIFTTSHNRFGFQVYRNSIEDVSSIGSNNGNVNGVNMDYFQVVTSKINMNLSYDQIENEISETDSTTSDLSINYIISETSTTLSLLRLEHEKRDEDSVAEDDTSIILEIRAKIF